MLASSGDTDVLEITGSWEYAPALVPGQAYAFAGAFAGSCRYVPEGPPRIRSREAAAGGRGAISVARASKLNAQSSLRWSTSLQIAQGVAADSTCEEI